MIALMKTKEGQELAEASARALIAERNGHPDAEALMLKAHMLEARALGVLEAMKAEKEAAIKATLAQKALGLENNHDTQGTKKRARNRY
jgi:hypothetical protein